MKRTLNKALSLVGVASFATACGLSNDRVNVVDLPEGSRAEENSTSQNGSAPTSPGTLSNPDTPIGNNYFYSFARSNPQDPLGMQQFGSRQTEMVSDAVQGLSGLKFSVDVETSPLKVRVADVKAKLAALRDKVREQDTVMIYTHSHGLLPGLGLDWETRDRNLVTYKWDDYAEAIVSLPAKNVIVFTMACHSGYLVESLQKISSKWQGSRKNAGRSLIVLTAVSKEQLSKPTDQDLTTGIGNPFNYAVRNALSGAADGAADGNKDGRTSFEELVKYVLKTAKEESAGKYAEPQFAGEYVPDASLF